MKTAIFKRAEKSFGQSASRSAGSRVARWADGLLLLSLLWTTSLSAATVDTLGGGPVQGNPKSYGYRDGDTFFDSQFSGPAGIALDAGNTNLYVADLTNNAVRKLDFISGLTSTFITNSNISRPIGVALDRAGNVYVLNRGNGNNGSILKFDRFKTLRATNAVSLTNATAIAIDGFTNLYATVSSNRIIRVTPAGSISNLVTITNAGTALQGLAITSGGLLAATDSGNHGIWLVDPATPGGNPTRLTGFNGAGDTFGLSDVAQFNRPSGIAAANAGVLIVADRGNHRVKKVEADGTVVHFYGIPQSQWFPGAYSGWFDGEACDNGLGDCAEAREPFGVAIALNGDIYTTEIFYHIIRITTGTGLPPAPPPPPGTPTIASVGTNFGSVTLTWTAVAGATSYNVKRSTSSSGPYTIIASTTATTYTDTTVLNGTTYYYVVSAVNAGNIEGSNSAQVGATPPLPPVPDPQIGYVTFPFPDFLSQLNPVASYVANNDVKIAIKGDPGSLVFYASGPTGSVPDPTTNGSTPPFYADNRPEGELNFLGVGFPDMTIKAVGTKPDGSPNSAIVEARFQFVVGNPTIIGNNAAQFTITDVTAGAQLFYTLDGSDPSETNLNAVDLGTVATPTNVWNVSFSVLSNTLFKVRAFRANYQPSAVVSNMFSATNFVANRISFGFVAGEASSDFIASPGQRFYAPVTLSLLPAATMNSLQFNMTVTNVAAAPVGPYNMAFESHLVRPRYDIPSVFTPIPPAMFIGGQSNPPPDVLIYTNELGGRFVDLRFTNNTLNLIGVGWLEREGQATNLYNTLQQDLITFSLPHDTLFESSAGRVVVGSYSFVVPTGAAPGLDQYRIQLGRPSATTDGIGMPGSLVFIDTPSSGSTSNGPINATKLVRVGQKKYIAGDAAPFRWFNAGDFGDSTLLNDDVTQVFQSAVYGFNTPPDGSDFFDGMDSCCQFGIPDPNGYLTESGFAPLDQNVFFNTDDGVIDSIPFGDGGLNVADVYVTLRRSLDPSRVWFRRFWTNGVLAAETTTNVFLPPGGGGGGGPEGNPLSPNEAAVSFAGVDIAAAAGQTIQVPIRAKIQGSFPLRVLMLNLTVQPLDGSPALTDAVQFNANPALGAPTRVHSTHAANYAAAWLNNAIAGLTGEVTLGTLTIKVPAGAGSSAAYAVHFDHASASPNGIGIFPRQARTGLVTLADRSTSTFGDGIPDSWRLRWFGSIYNVLSQANADADGDGSSNWHEYKAGTDPNDVKSILRASSKNDAGAGKCVIRWPTAADKQYVIEKSATLYGVGWTPVSTNAGTGWDMEYHDTNVTGPSFYRVRVVE